MAGTARCLQPTENRNPNPNRSRNRNPTRSRNRSPTRSLRPSPSPRAKASRPRQHPRRTSSLFARRRLRARLAGLQGFFAKPLGQAPQHSVASRSLGSLDVSGLCAKFVSVDRTNGLATHAPQHPSEDDQPHGQRLVQKHRPTDRNFHESTRLQLLFRGECDAPASHVDRLARAGCNHGPISNHFVPQLTRHLKAEFGPPVFLLSFLRFHGDRVPPPILKPCKGSLLPETSDHKIS